MLLLVLKHGCVHDDKLLCIKKSDFPLKKNRCLLQVYYILISVGVVNVIVLVL